MNITVFLLRFGRVLYGISLVAFGVLHLVFGDFVTRVITHWPESLPAKALWVYLTGGLLVAAGGSVLTGWRPRRLLVVLAGVLGLSLLGLHLPAAVSDVFIGSEWTRAGKALVMLGGCLAVAATFRGKGGDDLPGSGLIDGRLPFDLGRTVLAAFMVLCGMQHFRWFEFVVTLVPTWVPGGGPFWAYASAVLLVAGGLGMLIPATRQWAALLSGVMIFLWTFMLHLPMALNAVGAADNETTATFEALGFSGLAFLYAANAMEVRRGKEADSLLSQRMSRQEGATLKG